MAYEREATRLSNISAQLCRWVSEVNGLTADILAAQHGSGTQERVQKIGNLPVDVPRIQHNARLAVRHLRLMQDEVERSLLEIRTHDEGVEWIDEGGEG